MEGVMSPRESAKLIADSSKDVSIHQDGVTKVAKMIVDLVKTKSFSVKMWKEHELNPKSMDKKAVDWVFLADTLNFSFWSDDDSKKYMVRYNGKEHTGYWSLCAAINRALDDKQVQPSKEHGDNMVSVRGRDPDEPQQKGVLITDPEFYSKITEDEFMQVFRSDSPFNTPIPMVKDRVQVLHEAGQMLVKKYKGSFENCIKQCGKSAQKLLQLIVQDFPAYRDIADYNGKKVSFYKRAQILIADIWGACEGKGLGEFTDIDTITMFADYRIPQALVYFGALEYSDELMKRLKNGDLMKSGERQEVEIRGCSIWATELVRDEVRKMLDADPETKDVEANAILIDHYLWDYRRDHAKKMEDIPFHKVRCIYY